MLYLSEILSLVEAAIAGDRMKGTSYANMLAEKLEIDGDSKAAQRIRKSIQSSPFVVGSNGMDRLVRAERLLPVDSESRLSLADETILTNGDVTVYFDSNVSETVDEFTRYVKASDELIAEGVGISPSMLLYGPPGCGKSELAKYIASNLNLPLVTARIDTIISSFLGSTSKNLRLLFDHVAGRPCVLFLDEVDAIAKLRDDRQELGELKRVVVSLLQNLDALQGNQVLLAATNHEHLLDPAIWRRFSYRLEIGKPKRDARRQMFAKFLALEDTDKSLDKFADCSQGLSGSDIKEICDNARRSAILQRERVSDSDILRRLLHHSLGGKDLSRREIIEKAKELNSKVYTHRRLADILSMSPGNITHILTRGEK